MTTHTILYDKATIVGTEIGKNVRMGNFAACKSVCEAEPTCIDAVFWGTNKANFKYGSCQMYSVTTQTVLGTGHANQQSLTCTCD